MKRTRMSKTVDAIPGEIVSEGSFDEIEEETHEAFHVENNELLFVKYLDRGSIATGQTSPSLNAVPAPPAELKQRHR